MICKRPNPAAGFSLLEIMFALVILSLAVIALLDESGDAARAAAAVEARAMAGIVAENILTEAVVQVEELRNEIDTGAVEMAGAEWVWTRTVTPTDIPTMQMIKVTVTAEDETQTLAELTGFRGER